MSGLIENLRILRRFTLGIHFIGKMIDTIKSELAKFDPEKYSANIPISDDLDDIELDNRSTIFSRYLLCDADLRKKYNFRDTLFNAVHWVLSVVLAILSGVAIMIKLDLDTSWFTSALVGSVMLLIFYLLIGFLMRKIHTAVANAVLPRSKYYDELWETAISDNDLRLEDPIVRKAILEELEQCNKRLVRLANEVAVRLKELYSLNLVHEKYRSAVALEHIFESIVTGRCERLEGHGGAYDTYENYLLFRRMSDDREPLSIDMTYDDGELRTQLSDMEFVVKSNIISIGIMPNAASELRENLSKLSLLLLEKDVTVDFAASDSAKSDQPENKCFCGHDCARCLVFLSTVGADSELRERALEFYRSIGHELTPERIHCLGGRSKELFELCRECPFSACCRERGLDSCEACPEKCDAFLDYFGKYVNKCCQI